MRYVNRFAKYKGSHVKFNSYYTDDQIMPKEKPDTTIDIPFMLLSILIIVEVVWIVLQTA